MRKTTFAPHIAGILLAAGSSIRMGNPKQLIYFKKTPLIVHTLNNLLKSSLDEIILVLGHKHKEILNRLGTNLPERLKIAINYQHKKGLSSSIKKGVSLLSPATIAVFIFLADQPFIGPGIIDKMIKVYLKDPSPDKITASFYGKKRGHPVLFGKAFFKELGRLKGDCGARSILKKYSKKIIKVRFSNPSILLDFDSPEDLLALR